MTSDLPNSSSTTSLSLTLGSKSTKERCSFCNERPFDVICQCGVKFDFVCVGSHVEAINFDYHEAHKAAGKELEKLESAKKNLHFDAYQDAVDHWVRMRTQDIHDIAEAAKAGFKTHEQIGTETEEMADLYKQLDETQNQSAHDRLAFILEVKQHIQDMQSKLQSMLSSTAECSQLDESLRAKLSSSSSATSSNGFHSLNNGFDSVRSRGAPTGDEVTVMKRQVSPHHQHSSANDHYPSVDRHVPTYGSSSTASTERPVTNGFDRDETPSVAPTRTANSAIPSSPQRQTYVPPSMSPPVEPAASSFSSTTRVDYAPPSSVRVEAPAASPPTRVDPSPAPSHTEIRSSFTGFSPAPREEVPEPASPSIPTFEPPPTVNPPVESPKISAKPDIPIPEPVDNGNSDEFDPGLSAHISRRVFKNVPAKNDQNAGTVCSHDDQLLYVDIDDATKRPQVIYLPNVQQPDEKLIMDWVPPVDTGSSGGDEDGIRDIAYCDHNDTYMLITQTCIFTWNDIDDRFKEYHRMVGRQLKRITTDQHFIYLISASGRMTARGDTVIFLTYDKEEVSKAFTDIIPSRMNRGTAPLNGEITDIAVGSRDQLMITYRIERRSEVGICLFSVTNRGRDWSCVKQLQLNECWHASLNYTPRVEWSSKLNVFVLIEYMTGHLLMIDQTGHVQGECRFTHNDGKSESPINLTISNRDWLCTRYDSTIVVKKLE